MINFNDTTPAAPSDGINILWQVDVSGNLSGYVPSSNLSSSAVDLAAQVANISATNILASADAALYRVSAYIIVASVGTTSTMPKVTITWTDFDNGVAQSFDLTATSAGNTTTTFAQGTLILSAQAATAIKYATSGYASSGTPMQYGLHLRLEKL